MSGVASDRPALQPVRDHTFLGTERSVEKPIVHADGEIHLWFDAADCVPWIRQARKARTYDWRLVDGYLPAVEYTYRDPGSNRTCEMTAFAADREPAGAISVYVRLVERSGAGTAVRAFRLRDGAPVDPPAFEAALQALRERWRRFFDEGAPIECRDPLVMQACKASLVRALITFTGRHPHYGVRGYESARDDGFPPAVISLVDCLTDWGHAPLAREYLAYWFERFVTNTGRIDYYGPSLAEYGQLLSLVGKLADAAPDRDWLDAVRPKGERVRPKCERARSKYERVREWIWAQQADSPHGLIAGVPEADTRAEVDVYFHNNAWCWRGLRDAARALGHPDDEARCEAWRRAILDAIEAVTDRSTVPAFIPPVARRVQPFESMTQDDLASYTNYRYWPELLSSGILPHDTASAIVEYRRSRGGEIAGMTAFRDHADNWPIAEYARGLLHLGRTDDARRVLLDHLAGHVTPQTWTAYEQVTTNAQGDRRAAADYCVPAQLVAPRLLAWLSQAGVQI